MDHKYYYREKTAFDIPVDENFIKTFQLVVILTFSNYWPALQVHENSSFHASIPEAMARYTWHQ